MAKSRVSAGFSQFGIADLVFCGMGVADLVFGGMADPVFSGE
jgi:hypothetical protein